LYDEIRYPTDEYERNLNIGSQLGAQNVEALLEWKLAFIPEREREILVLKLAPRVSRRLESFNEFRSLQEVSEEQFNEFWNLCQGLAREVERGFVIGAFLLHIARPLDYPMADQHALRAYHFIEMGEVADPPQNLETYVEYRIFLRWRERGLFGRSLGSDHVGSNEITFRNDSQSPRRVVSVNHR
jgi:hypothetical protein